MEKAKLITRDFSKCQGKISNVLYQQSYKTFSKSLIQSMQVTNISSFNIEQQRMEQLVNQINQRMLKIQKDSNNLHHQFRVINFDIDRKMTHIKNQLKGFNYYQQNQQNATNSKRRSKRISQINKTRKNSRRTKNLHTFVNKTGKIADIKWKKSLRNQDDQKAQNLNLDLDLAADEQSQFDYNQYTNQKQQFNIEQIQEIVSNSIQQIKQQLIKSVKVQSQKVNKQIEMIINNMNKLQANYVSKNEYLQSQRQILSAAQKMIDDRINITKDELRVVLHSSLDKSLNDIRKTLENDRIKITLCQSGIQKLVVNLVKVNNQIEQIKQKMIKNEEQRKQIYADRQQTKNAFLFLQNKLNKIIDCFSKQLKQNKRGNVTQNINHQKSQKKLQHNQNFYQSLKSSQSNQIFSRRKGTVNHPMTQMAKIIASSSNIQKNINDKTQTKLNNSQINQQFENQSFIFEKINKNSKANRKSRIASVNSISFDSNSLHFGQKKHQNIILQTQNLNLWKKRTNQILQKSNKKKLF